MPDRATMRVCGRHNELDESSIVFQKGSQGRFMEND